MISPFQFSDERQAEYGSQIGGLKEANINMQQSKSLHLYISHKKKRRSVYNCSHKNMQSNIAFHTSEATAYNRAKLGRA